MSEVSDEQDELPEPEYYSDEWRGLDYMLAWIGFGICVAIISLALGLSNWLNK